MTDINFLQAANAYKNAKKMADNVPESGGSAVALPAGQPSFKDLVQTGLDNARDAGYNSEIVSTKAVANQAELHELVTAVSNAELTLNTVVAIRDRIISAYQDIIKMPI